MAVRLVHSGMMRIQSVEVLVRSAFGRSAAALVVVLGLKRSCYEQKARPVRLAAWRLVGFVESVQ